MNAPDTVRGLPILRADIPQWAVDRFHKNYAKAASGCLEWQGALNSKGYGCVRINGTAYSTHRLAFVLWYGELPAGTLVAHHCDNPKCVNPLHLFPTDNNGNMADMVAKKRHYSQKKTHCKRGHEFTPENTRVRAKDRGRTCIACEVIMKAKARAAYLTACEATHSPASK